MSSVVRRRAAAFGQLNTDNDAAPTKRTPQRRPLGQMSSAAAIAASSLSFSAAKPDSVSANENSATVPPSLGAGLARYLATQGCCLYSRRVFPSQISSSDLVWHTAHSTKRSARTCSLLLCQGMMWAFSKATPSPQAEHRWPHSTISALRISAGIAGLPSGMWSGLRTCAAVTHSSLSETAFKKACRSVS